MTLELSPLAQNKIHGFYLATRELLASDVVTPTTAQRGFEEVIAGVMCESVWRPTHVSWAAATEMVGGGFKNVQRAHGIGGRLDRHTRTVQLLSGPEQSFSAWWNFFVEHDATVLITRKEHSSGKQFAFSDLIELPPYPNGLFVSSGFSFKVRKKVEIKWLTEIMQASKEQ